MGVPKHAVCLVRYIMTVISCLKLRRLAFSTSTICQGTKILSMVFASLLIMLTPKNGMHVKEIDGFLSLVIGQKFGLLRVLDLERVYKSKLPNNMGKLFLLFRYLGLRWTFLDTLPYSVGELPYLETLDVKHTYISSLPSSI